MAPSTRRKRGTFAVIGLLVLAAAAVIPAWFLLRDRPAPGDIVDIVALDAEHAVVVRDLEGESKRSFVSLFHRHNGERWGALIPRVSASRGARTAIAATGEAVTVRVIASDGAPTIFAFAGMRGHKLGQVAPLGEDRVDPAGGSFELPGASNVFGNGMSFEVYGEPGVWATVVATDLERGTFLWRAELGAAPVGPMWLRDDYVLVHQPGVLRVFERRSGMEQTIELYKTACVAGSIVFILEPDGTLRTSTLGASERGLPQLQEARILNALPPGMQLAGLCGWYDSTLILAVRGPTDNAALIALSNDAEADSRMQQRWRLDLDASWADTEVAAHVPDAVPLSGMLTRFVPVALRASPADRGAARLAPDVLAMIDMDSGRVAWRSQPLPWLGEANLMTVDGRHYLASSRREILARFDGATGALAATANLVSGPDNPDAAVRYQTVWPKQIAGGHIWLFSGKHWLVLDAITLAVLPSAGDTAPIPAVNAELATELGAPLASVQ